jgi:hypothetical protein
MSLEIHYFSGLLCRDSSLNSSSKLVEIDRFDKKAKALWLWRNPPSIYLGRTTLQFYTDRRSSWPGLW